MHARFIPALDAYFAGRPAAPIGYRRDGRPIFPIAGGAPDDPPPEGGNETGKQDPPPFKPPESQEEFDRIINQAVGRTHAKYADYAELQKKAAAHDKALEDAQTEQEKAVAAARKEGEQNANSQNTARLIAAEARAVAASARFRNPSAAVKLADLSEVTMDDSGEVDSKALKAALDALAESDPYLIEAPGETKSKPKPDPSQGNGGGKPVAGADARAYMQQRYGNKSA